MTWLKEKIKNHPHLALAVPTLLSCVSFVGDLVNALTDGRIDGAEFHNLFSSANGLESIILIVIMVALKQKKH